MEKTLPPYPPKTVTKLHYPPYPSIDTVWNPEWKPRKPSIVSHWSGTGMFLVSMFYALLALFFTNSMAFLLRLKTVSKSVSVSTNRCTYISHIRTTMSSFASTNGGAAEATGSFSSDPIISDIVLNTEEVKTKMSEAATKAGRLPSSVKLVAVSKTKPNEDLMTLYNAGQRDFGENYFQELLDKAEALPKDINWHFIGHLQSAKANRLVREVPSLTVIETVDTLKLAKKLNTACELANRPKLNIYLQVDTSGEDTKSGIPIPETSALALSIRDECPLLHIAGLMTIGAPGDMSCFDRLVETRVDVATALGTSIDELGLSMGMSGDYEEAIARGATSVRVGSTIFGARNYPATKG